MKLTLTNLHPSLRPPFDKWLKIISRLINKVSHESKRFPSFLLVNLNVVWIDDKKIKEINQRYLRHCGSTDVLTFDYGEGFSEILISLDTVKKHARRYGQTFDQELTLYLAHGVLHLAGLQDKTSSQSRRMRQEEKWLLLE